MTEVSCKYDYNHELIIFGEGPPDILMSRHNGTCFSLFDNKNAGYRCFLSSLSQALYNLDDGRDLSYKLDDDLYNNALSIVGGIIVKVGNNCDVATGNVINYIVYTARGISLDEYQNVVGLLKKCLYKAKPIYTRSNGEVIVIEDMHDGHLVNAFAKSWRAAYPNVNRDVFATIASVKDPKMKMAILATSLRGFVPNDMANPPRGLFVEMLRRVYE